MLKCVATHLFITAFRLATPLLAANFCMDATAAPAQTLPSGVINVPPTIIGDDESIGSNTTLNVMEGGVVGNNFDAGLPDQLNENVVVNISGGTIGYLSSSFPPGSSGFTHCVDNGFRVVSVDPEPSAVSLAAVAACVLLMRRIGYSTS